MRAGKVMTPGRHPDILHGFDIELAPIDLAHYEEYLGYANWFYRSLPQPFPAMQCLWPDRSGVLPYEENFDPRCARLQPVLTRPQ